MSGKHRKTTAVVKNPVQSAPRHKDTRVEVDAPSRAAGPLGHKYVGNICSGFGGTTECEWFDLDTRQRCGRDPGAHEPVPSWLDDLLRPIAVGNPFSRGRSL
jgi:hypothetical protein